MSEVAQLNPSMGTAMEALLIDGDLSKLTPEQRVTYYKKTCDSLGLNYLTKPFAYIRLNGKLTFYALKDCTEQLRKRDGVSIVKLESMKLDDVFVVTAYAQSSAGKMDVATGAVPTANLKGENLANALMKAETKAKRRVTLSICGLGMTDEEEISSIPTAQKIEVNIQTGEIEEATITEVPALAAPKSDEEVLAAISPEQGTELANEISTARDMDSLKSAYARCYALHAGRLPLMVEFTKLKDMRKKHLETYTQEQMEGTYDDVCPDLAGAPA
jgi:hypothetical protein